MTHTNGYASMVELFAIKVIYVALDDPNGVDKSFLHKRLGNVKASIQRDSKMELQCQPIIMNPARSIQVFGAMPGKLRLEVTYDGVVESVSYSGAYAIHWTPKLVPINRAPSDAVYGILAENHVAHSALRERVADLCHQLWAECTLALFLQGHASDDGTWTLPSGVHDKLNRKLLAKYPSVSWEDRDAYRAQADKFLECILVQGTSQ